MRVGEKESLESCESSAGALERRKLESLSPIGAPAEEETVDLMEYWQAIRKRRWTVLTLLFVAFTFVLLWTLKQQRIYRSEVLIEIGRSREKENLKDFAGSENDQGPSEFETQIQILQSKTLARRVIADLRLDRNPDFNPASHGPPRHNLQREPSDIMAKNFLAGLEIRPVKGSRLLWASYEYKDPEMAARIVNALANDYIQQNLEAHWQSAQVASEWLGQKLNETRVGLEKAEEKLQVYARENGLFFMASKTDQPEQLIADRLARLQDELGKAETERFKEQWLGELAQKDTYTATSVPGLFEDHVTQTLEGKITELKSKRAEMTATFNSDYPKAQELQYQIDELEKLLVQERRHVALSTAQSYNAIVTRENLLRHAFEVQQSTAAEIAERAVQYNILKRDVDTNREMYNGLLQRLKEMGVAASLKASTVRVVDAAEPSKFPVRPRVKLNLIMGLVLGLGLGIGAALLQEMLDNTIKTSEDIERFLSLPILGLIPLAESLNLRGFAVSASRAGLKIPTDGAGEAEEEQLPLTVLPPTPTAWYRIDKEETQHTPLVEAFRSLRTSVLLSAANRPPRCLMVCSAQPSEGKTTVTVNLAISLAQLGERVLVMDCDLRRPSVHKVLGLKDGDGLAHCLIGQREWRTVVQPSGIAGVDVLVSGPVPPNPAELLSSEHMRSLIPQVVEAYNFVLIDSPPVLTVSDSRVLMPLVEAVILVVAGGITPRHSAQRARLQAREAGANIVGVVLNKADVRNHGYYGYYDYCYAEDSNAPTAEKVHRKT